jgi:hypothetical protein
VLTRALHDREVDFDLVQPRGVEKRDNGSSCVRGSSHAIALTSATCCGGKTSRPTRPRLIAQSLEAMFGKSSSQTPGPGPPRCPTAQRSRCPRHPARRTARSVRAAPPGRAASPHAPPAQARDAPRRRARSGHGAGAPHIQFNARAPDPFDRSDRYFRTRLGAPCRDRTQADARSRPRRPCRAPWVVHLTTACARQRDLEASGT